MTDERIGTAAPNDAVLAARDQIDAYRVAEFVTLARAGSPVGWPLNPDLEGDRLVFSTGYVYPAKARNAQRDPRVAVLYSDPTASRRTDADPLVLVQGRCEVLDADLQANTERYVAQHIRTASPLAPLLKVPMLRQLLVGYLTRIWMEVVPERVLSWPRTGSPPRVARCESSGHVHARSRAPAAGPGHKVGFALPASAGPVVRRRDGLAGRDPSGGDHEWRSGPAGSDGCVGRRRSRVARLSPAHGQLPVKRRIPRARISRRNRRACTREGRRVWRHRRRQGRRLGEAASTSVRGLAKGPQAEVGAGRPPGAEGSATCGDAQRSVTRGPRAWPNRPNSAAAPRRCLDRPTAPAWAMSVRTTRQIVDGPMSTTRPGSAPRPRSRSSWSCSSSSTTPFPTTTSAPASSCHSSARASRSWDSRPRPSGERHLADLRARSGLTTEQLIYRGRAEGWLIVTNLEPR